MPSHEGKTCCSEETKGSPEAIVRDTLSDVMEFPDIWNQFQDNINTGSKSAHASTCQDQKELQHEGKTCCSQETKRNPEAIVRGTLSVP